MKLALSPLGTNLDSPGLGQIGPNAYYLPPRVWIGLSWTGIRTAEDLLLVARILPADLAEKVGLSLPDVRKSAWEMVGRRNPSESLPDPVEPEILVVRYLQFYMNYLLDWVGGIGDPTFSPEKAREVAARIEGWNFEGARELLKSIPEGSEARGPVREFFLVIRAFEEIATSGRRLSDTFLNFLLEVPVRNQPAKLFPGISARDIVEAFRLLYSVGE